MKNTTFIIFGATGDLTKRKIIPAFYHFIAKQKLENFIIIGTALSDATAESMLEPAREFIDTIDNTIWNTLTTHTYYKKIDFTKKDDFIALKQFIEQCEHKHNFTENNRLFYLATASTFFCDITSSLAESGIAKRYHADDTLWHRIVYEKPFGYDRVSAQKINKCIEISFDESQIFRIDHYLSKEIVSNIAMIRFTNSVLEPLWSHKHIEHVQIILSESIGIDSRGIYYDEYGALCDVVQNHMLELLALVCMESPAHLSGDFIRAERAKVLERVQFVDGILGQYESYQKEKGVNPDSTTDTYATLQLLVDNPRWNGVPFYFKTGKKLTKKETVIHIKFKEAHCLLLRGCPVESNWLTIAIDPESSITLTLNVKKPESDAIVPVKMEFCHSCTFGPKTPKAYEILLEEITKGEQSIGVRCDEIEYAWDIIDAIKKHTLPLYLYKEGSTGPEEEKQWMHKHNMRWRS